MVLVVHGIGDEQLADLTMLLCDVVPQSVDPERAISTMGWFYSEQQANLLAVSNRIMTTIKTHFDAGAPKAAKLHRGLQDDQLASRNLTESVQIKDNATAHIAATVFTAQQQEQEKEDDSAAEDVATPEQLV
eukprot:GHRR01022838.1.p2 GENE.GHRR01022838.1~~GHRR01022838.1.p2  ORF type:complete len:132 (+),score=58.54 GHRR01022838.1:393-788(+)